MDLVHLAALLIVLLFVNALFWACFEQAGNSLNFFAQDHVGNFGAFQFEWFQSVNPVYIITLAPVFAWLWVKLGSREPSSPAKFAFGLLFVGLGFGVLILAASLAASGVQVSPMWLLVTYLVSTWGELCLSPVGLSMVTKLAPARLQSLLMGIWFFSLSLGNLFGGLAARFSKRLETGDATFVLQGLPGFYLSLVVFPIAAGALILLLTPLLRRMMHGVK